MKAFYEKYQGGQYSQNGEAGIIDEAIKRIGLKTGIAVEFGAPTKEYCSNIFHLSKLGWDCLFFDNDPKEEGIAKMTVTTENINTLPACSIISMDTDGPDLMLWAAYKEKPPIVIIEINSSLPPMQEHFTMNQGSSYITMLRLGIGKGYFLLCHTGNLIFVANEYRDKFPEIIGGGVGNYEDYFIDKWLNS